MRVECDAASNAVRNLRHVTEGRNWGLAIAGEMQGGQELICSCILLNVSRPCTSRAVSTSAALSAMSSFALLLLPIKHFLALSAKRSPQITSVVTPAGNSHFTMARPRGQLADIDIYWNGTSDETHQCLRQSYHPCHHLPGPSTSFSLAPSEAGVCWALSSPHWHGSHCGLPYRSRQITR